MKLRTSVITLSLLLAGLYGLHVTLTPEARAATVVIPKSTLFRIQAVDTMKESRDRAREVLNDPSYDKVIDAQMRATKDLGATHVSIATPYDEEFVPVLKRWVASARAHGLSVWFRGNFSGWEGWFEYPRISSAEHTSKTRAFILNHPDLFANGDIFSPCPECENGGDGDPRRTGKVSEYRNFLVLERQVSEAAFSSIGKKVGTPYPSMNADVARLIMDKKTTAALGGIVVIDHYVKSTDQFRQDIIDIGKKSGGDVALGEFGAPIPDLQGTLTESGQAAYVEKLMGALYRQNASVPLVNYWTLSGGSTALLNDNGTRRKAYYVVQKYFTAPYVSGTAINKLGDKLGNVSIQVTDGIYSYSMTTSSDGSFRVFLPNEATTVTVGNSEYKAQNVTLTKSNGGSELLLILVPTHPTVFYTVRTYLAGLQSYAQMVAALMALQYK